MRIFTAVATALALCFAFTVTACDSGADDEAKLNAHVEALKNADEAKLSAEAIKAHVEAINDVIGYPDDADGAGGANNAIDQFTPGVDPSYMAPRGPANCCTYWAGEPTQCAKCLVNAYPQQSCPC